MAAAGNTAIGNTNDFPTFCKTASVLPPQFEPIFFAFCAKVIVVILVFSFLFLLEYLKY
jgi:hypothetical protein